MSTLSFEALVTLILGVPSLIIALLSWWETRRARFEARANQHECIIFEVDASLFQSSSSSTQPRLYHHCHFSTSPSTTIPASQATEAPSRQQQTSYHHHSFSAPLELSISTTCLPAAPRLPQAAAWLESPLPPPASAAAAPTTRNHNYASTSPMNFSARRSQVVTRQAPRSVAIPVQ